MSHDAAKVYAGQITSTTQSSVDGPSVTLDYQYDDVGHRVQMAATIDGVADFVDDYKYDDSGRVVSVVEHGVKDGNAVADKEIDLAYNDAGQLLSIDRYQDGQLAVEGDYSYDKLGRLVGLVYHQGDNVLNSYAWTYSGSDQWSAASDKSPLPPGEGKGEGSLYWTPTGGLMPIHDTTGVTDALMSGGISALDLLTSCTSIDGTASYSYDAIGQLTGVKYSSPLLSGEGKGEGVQPAEAYRYDANGNRTNKGYVTGADNRLLSDGTYWYAYDAEGNRTERYVDGNENSILDTGDTDITAYSWDNRNRLIEVTDYDVFGGDATQIVDYLYDVENRWIGESIDSNGDGTIDRELAFAYDGNQIVLQFEKDGDGALAGKELSHRYLWQPDAVDQLLADEQLLPSAVGVGSETGTSAGYDLSQPGNVVWALTDNPGTVRDLAVLDEKAGVTSVANHRVYDSYGNLKSQTNVAVDCLFGFTGRAFDNATELQNNLNRWYDAKVGRWASEDPDRFYGRDTNTSRYCFNSPTNATDPSGLAPPPPPAGPEKSREDFSALKGALIGILGPNPPAAAIGEAEAIAKAITSAYNDNAAGVWWDVYVGYRSVVKFVTGGLVSSRMQKHRGHFCDEWANIFWNAVVDKVTHLNSEYFSITIGGATNPESPDPKNPEYHKWVEIKSKITGQSIYVDDGFARNHPGFVHNVPPVPKGYKQDK